LSERSQSLRRAYAFQAPDLDELERESSSGDKLRFKSSAGSDEDGLVAAILQLPRDGDCGDHVPAGSAACHEKGCHEQLTSSRRN
jgi:hypothetical protein